MKTKLLLFVSMVILLLSSSGCFGSSKPPYLGVFLKKGGDFIEMVEYKGGPDSLNDAGIPTTSDTQPMIVMWYPEVNTNLLGLFDEVRGGQVRYDANQKGEILEIRPEDPLEDGVYCLVQSDPTLFGSFIPYWCFRIGKEVNEKEMQKQFSRDDKATPPGDGLFLVENGKPITLVEYERIRNTPALLEDANTMPLTSNNRPIVLIQSPDKNVTQLSFYSGTAGMGFGCNDSPGQTIVSWVYENSGAYDAGLQQQDIILSVDGQDVAGDCDKVTDLARGQLGTQASFEILRGTSTSELTLTRKVIVDFEQVPFNIVAKGQFVQLIPDQILYPGIYCYTYNNSRWCFKIE